MFAGYRRHLGLMLGEPMRAIPRWLREGMIRPLVDRLPESSQSSDRVDHLKRFVRSAGAPAADRYQDAMTTIAGAGRRALLHGCGGRANRRRRPPPR